MSTKDEKIEQQEVRGQELAEIELVEGKRSKKGLLLRPQPSNDPNDPLVCISCTPGNETPSLSTS
jgi:hypothetical protein